MTVRVLLIERNEDGTVGGSHQCLFDLARLVDRVRFKVIALFYQDNPFVPLLRDAGIEVVTWDRERAAERAAMASARGVGRLIAHFQALTRRRRLIRDLGIDIVHLNNDPVIGVDWLPAARLSGAACITHSRGPVLVPGNLIRRRLIGRFDRVIAISDLILESAHAAGIAPARCVRIYDGVDIEALWARVKSPAAVVRGVLGVDHDTMLVLMVGTLQDWKGQHVLLAALGLLSATERSRLRVIFAGGVPPEAEPYHLSLVSTVERESLGSCVRFLGQRGDVPELMNAADVIVHASTYPEPLGLVVLEGMALGRAVVAARLGGPLETTTKESALLFDPSQPAELAAHLRLLMREPDTRRRLGEAGRAQAQRFSANQSVEHVQAIYESLAGGSK